MHRHIHTSRHLLAVVAVNVLAVFGSSAVAERTDNGLRIVLDVKTFKTVSGKTITKYIVTLENSGEEPATVLLAGGERSIERTRQDGPSGVLFGLRTQVTSKSGKRIIPSLSDLKPVDLRKGEAAVLEIEKQPFGNIFKRIPQSGKLVVSYEVSPAWGRRLGIWHGKVSTEPFGIRDGIVVVSDEER